MRLAEHRSCFLFPAVHIIRGQIIWVQFSRFQAVFCTAVRLDLCTCSIQKPLSTQINTDFVVLTQTINPQYRKIDGADSFSLRNWWRELDFFTQLAERTPARIFTVEKDEEKIQQALKRLA
ncbi:hypothetical protein RQN30_08480 [Arcanobacterium hippocoleae]